MFSKCKDFNPVGLRSTRIAFGLLLLFAALASPRAIALDRDLDGLSDAEEAAAGTDVLSPDTDGDGLWDSWEVKKQVLSTPLENADPKRKDLYIEIDRFTGSLSDDERAILVSDLRTAFALRGVALHLEWDETLPVGTGQDVLSSEEWEDLRSAHFDLRKKGLSHRHAFYGLKLRLSDGRWLDGLAEDIPAQSFVLASRKPDSSPFTRIDLAATFMHELGHTLGIGHGGVTNGLLWGVKPDLTTMMKPNHLSVMNYSWSDSGLIHQTSASSDIVALIDYQSFRLPALDETSLKESDGLQFPSGSPALPGLQTRARIAGEESKDDGRNVLATGSIDWNRNSVPTDEKVKQSVNGDAEFTTLKLTLNEWGYLTFDAGRIGAAWWYLVLSISP